MVPDPMLAAPPAPDPVYYPARQLDVYPALLESVSPIYPLRAEQENVSGKVILMLLIDQNGVVNDLSVMEAGPAGYFEESARTAFLAARFSPARKDGRAVKSRVLISVSFGDALPRNATP